jgi:hypothetical protein
VNRLQRLEAALGPAPRGVRWTLTYPSWLTRSHPLYGTREALGPLIAEGRPTWGQVVLGNTALWDGQKLTAPGQVVYSFEPYLAAHPEELVPIASGLFALHGDEPTRVAQRPWERVIQDAVRGNPGREFHKLLPPELCGGWAVYLSTVLVDTRILPNDRLSGEAVPLLVAPDRDGPNVTVVHRDFWG